MCKKLYEGERAQAFLALFEKDKTLQKIAKYRYVDGLTYAEVGMLIGYCERHVQRLCKKIEQIADCEVGWKADVMNTFLGGKL